jgi:hypothetical protein
MRFVIITRNFGIKTAIVKLLYDEGWAADVKLVPTKNVHKFDEL